MDTTGRVRKPNSKYEGEVVTDENFQKAISSWSKGKPTKKRLLSDQFNLENGNFDVVKNDTEKKGRVKGESSKKIKVQKTPVIPLSSKEKALDEAEERLIASAWENKSKIVKLQKELPVGAQEQPDVNSAVKKGVKDCTSLLLNWNTKNAKIIGALCKVYWDGDDEWFYGRILNYDNFHNRHYIYYVQDNTAEWISLENESVFICDEMVLARMSPSSPLHPAMHYWVNEKARREAAHFIPGYVKGAEYIEFFGEKAFVAPTYAYLPKTQYMHIRDEFLPKVQSKKFKSGYEAARLEQETNNSVIEIVVKAVRDSIFTVLKGDKWIGLRVRASTHRVQSVQNTALVTTATGRTYSNNSSAQAIIQGYALPVAHESAQCVGTITHYCAATDQHFVVFDEEALQPQWLTCQKGVVDVLIGPFAEGSPAPHTGAAGKRAISGKRDHYDCMMCAVPGCVENITDGTLVQCEQCAMVCHPYCIPVNSPAPVQTTAGKPKLNQPQIWNCWNCQACDGCGCKVYHKELMHWNIRRIEPELGPEKSLLLCGDCLYRYKHVRDFCSICFKLYATDESMLNLVDIPPAMHCTPGDGSSQVDVLAVVEHDNGIFKEPSPSSPVKETKNPTGSRSGLKRAEKLATDTEEKESKEDGWDESRANSIHDSDFDQSSDEEQQEKNKVVLCEPSTEISPSNARPKRKGGRKSVTKKAAAPKSATKSSAAPAVVASDAVASAALAVDGEEEPVKPQVVKEEENMVQCSECMRWVHAECEGIDAVQYAAMTEGTHPVWGDEYLCPLCRVRLGVDIIETLQAEDGIFMFAEPVTTAVAKNYFDVIRNPMDLRTMTNKCKKGLYKSLQTLRQDFELMCLNAIVFNKTGDEYWLAARAFHDKVQLQFDTQARLSHISAYGFELKQLIEEFNATTKEAAARVAEERRAAEWDERYNKSGTGAKRKYRTESNAVDSSSVGMDVETDAGAESANGNEHSKKSKIYSSSPEKIDGTGGSNNVDGAIHIKREVDTTENSSSSAAQPLNALSMLADAAPLAIPVVVTNMLPSAVLANVMSAGGAAMDAIDKENETNKIMLATLDVVLPVSLAPCPDPRSFLPCSVTIQTSEEGFFTCCQDVCLLCGSAGSSAVFLYCVDCGEAMHSFCADAPLVSMSQTVREHWRCMNCKVCETCGVATEEEESSLLYCEMCDRAHHIGCMEPSMTGVPTQSKWFCDECVNCSACNRMEAPVESSGVALVPAVDGEKVSEKKRCWGFAADKCVVCSEAEEKERVRVETERKEQVERQRVLEEQRRKQAILNMYLCNVCTLDCSESYLICTNCGQNTHPKCNPAVCEPWTKDRATLDFCCVICLNNRLQCTTSHVGSGDKAMELLQMVARIQRRRNVQVLTNNNDVLRASGVNLLRHWSPHRALMSSILYWACRRAFRMESDNVTAELALRTSQQRDLFLPSWARFRAERFLVMWNRRGRMTDYDFQTFRYNLSQGQDIDGELLEIKTLSRYATMAATFLQCTSAEMSEGRLTEELLPVAAMMVSWYAANHSVDASESEENLSGSVSHFLVQEYAKVMALAVARKPKTQDNGNSASSSVKSFTSPAPGTLSTVDPSIVTANLAQGVASDAGSTTTDSISANLSQQPSASEDLAKSLELQRQRAQIQKGEQAREIERSREVLQLIKAVYNVLLCPPIGLRGAMPDGYAQNSPLDILKHNLHPHSLSDKIPASFTDTAADAEVMYWHDASQVPAVNQDLPSLEQLSETDKPATTSTEAADASHSRIEGDVVGAAVTSNDALYKPELGFPSTILQKMKRTFWIPGYISRSNLLLSSVGSGSNKVVKKTVLQNIGELAASRVLNTVANVSHPASLNTSSRSKSRAALCDGRGRPRKDRNKSQASSDLNNREIMDNRARWVRGGSKIEDFTSVCLFAGAGYYAQRSRIQRLEPLTSEQEEAFLKKAEAQPVLVSDGSKRLSQLIDTVRTEKLNQIAANQQQVSEDNNAMDVGKPSFAAQEDTLMEDEALILAQALCNFRTSAVDSSEVQQIEEAAKREAVEYSDANAVTLATSGDPMFSEQDLGLRGRGRGSVVGEEAGRERRGRRPKVANKLYPTHKFQTDLGKETLFFDEGDSYSGFDVHYPYCMEPSPQPSLQQLQSGEDDQILTRPLRGWESGRTAMPWQDPRNCCFCRSGVEDHVVGRLLVYSDGFFVHVNCLRWSADVIERDSVLLDSYRARDRANLGVACYFCHMKGATVGCMNKKKKCNRVYHLRCAMANKCALMECRLSGGMDNAPHDIITYALCPEHASSVVDHPGLTRPWTPMDPNRCLLIEDNDDIFTENIPEQLSQKKGNKYVRSGALSILNIGNPRIDLVEFHSQDYVYPHRFKSCRIYWSGVAPKQRTLYVFDILHETDLETLPGHQQDYIAQCLDSLKLMERPDSKHTAGASLVVKHNDDQSDNGRFYPAGSNNSPVFRVVAMDAPDKPLFAKSVEQLYDLVRLHAEHCNEAYRAFSTVASTNDRKFHRRQCVGSYGLNAHQFFGLGQSFTRHAIELIPESIAAMVVMKPYEQYKPSFVLPSEGDARRVYQRQLAAKLSGAMSTHGCARADGYTVGATRPTGVRITKILSKTVGDKASDDKSSGATGGRGKRDDEDAGARPDDSQVDESKGEESRRENEYNRQRYLEMSAAYLRNPYAKLEVQKSRIHGWGLFAKINFEKNDIIVEYIGEKIRQVVADRRETRYEDEGVGSCYLFRLDKEDIVDATRCGGMARFMNHCCEPNAYARVISSTDPSTSATAATSGSSSGVVAEEKHIVIIAARDIQEGEEVTYDYKFPIEEKKLKCYCGAAKCQGSMN